MVRSRRTTNRFLTSTRNPEQILLDIKNLKNKELVIVTLLEGRKEGGGRGGERFFDGRRGRGDFVTDCDEEEVYQKRQEKA